MSELQRVNSRDQGMFTKVLFEPGKSVEILLSRCCWSRCLVQLCESIRPLCRLICLYLIALIVEGHQMKCLLSLTEPRCFVGELAKKK